MLLVDGLLLPQVPVPLPLPLLVWQCAAAAAAAAGEEARFIAMHLPTAPNPL